MRTEYCFFTDKGSRPVNEDYSGHISSKGMDCFILCDGLGGHGMGDKASQFVVEYVKEYFENCASLEEFTTTVANSTQKALRNEQADLGFTDKMKTTAVILVINGSEGVSIHVGDSRMYHFRNNEVIFRTRDHSIPQMLVLTGEISEDEIRSHPDRNKVLRAFGDDREELKCEISGFDIEEGDTFLLCSDGFWEPVTEKEMTDSLKKTSSMEEWLEVMSVIARDNSEDKKMDNFTAVAVGLRGEP